MLAPSGPAGLERLEDALLERATLRTRGGGGLLGGRSGFRGKQARASRREHWGLSEPSRREEPRRPAAPCGGDLHKGLIDFGDLGEEGLLLFGELDELGKDGGRKLGEIHDDKGTRTFR